MVTARKEKIRTPSAMEAFSQREGERAQCLTFCRDTIARLADKDTLQKAQIETLLSDKVSKRHCPASDDGFVPALLRPQSFRGNKRTRPFLTPKRRAGQ